MGFHGQNFEIRNSVGVYLKMVDEVFKCSNEISVKQDDW